MAFVCFVARSCGFRDGCGLIVFKQGIQEEKDGR